MRIRQVTPRFRRSHAIYNDQPFSGSGVSLYVTVGESVQYRNLRIVGNGHLQTANWLIGTGSVLKTTRVASEASPVSSISVPVDSTWESETITVDVRTYADNVENNTDNYRPARVELDGSGEAQPTIQGVATLIGTEARSGGVCIVRVAFENAVTGLQADTLTLVRTAGPTTPADVDLEVVEGREVYEFETEVLMDTAPGAPSPYTFKIVGSAGAVDVDLLTGISVTADSTGPDAPSSGTGVPW